MYYSQPCQQELRLSASNYNRDRESRDRERELLEELERTRSGRPGRSLQRASSADHHDSQERDITGMLNNFSKALGKSKRFFLPKVHYDLVCLRFKEN